MRRGEIRLIDLEPARGSEANKHRPPLIVSNDRANATADRLARGFITVVPVTSSIAQVFAFQTLLPADATGLRVISKAQAEQVRSVSIERVGGVLGRVPADLTNVETDARRRSHRIRRSRLGRHRWPPAHHRPTCSPTFTT